MPKNIQYLYQTCTKFFFLLGLLNRYTTFTYHYCITTPRYLKHLVSWCFLDFNVQAKIFCDVVALDFPTKRKRFTIVWNVQSLLFHTRFFVYLWLSELDKLYSVTDIYPMAVWYEREVWDLFGIVFIENKDLRRILTDYGFYGFPLRKDFPLSGFGEVYYDSLVDSVLYRKSKLNQAYRFFETLSPWAFFHTKKLN